MDPHVGKLKEVSIMGLRPPQIWCSSLQLWKPARTKLPLLQIIRGNRVESCSACSGPAPKVYQRLGCSRNLKP